MKSAIQTILVACAIAGCSESTKPIDLGKQRTASVGSSLSEYAGSWTGYVEAFAFNDGTDRIRLTLDEQGNGTLAVGEADPLPAPAADRPFPPELPPSESDSRLISGFDYPIGSASVADGRIRLQTFPSEIYREWCSLMEPHAYTALLGPEGQGAAGARAAFNGAGGSGWDAGSLTETVLYGCDESVGRLWFGDEQGNCFDMTDGTPVPAECPTGCDGVCECSQQGCSLRDLPDTIDPMVRLDATLSESGNRLEGTLVEGQTRIQVRMTR